MSLSSEQVLLNIAKKNGWKGSQGYYYQDPFSGKTRETDLHLRRCWKSKDKNSDLFAALDLFIEAKSATGYHILFSKNSTPQKWLQVHHTWIGNLIGSKSKKLTDLLLSKGLSPSVIEKFYKEAYKKTFPDDTYKINNVKPDTPLIEQVSAFRETNTQNEKELENSVFWKASQSLKSVVTAAKARDIANILSDIDTTIEASQLFNEKPLNSLISHINSDSGQVEMYYPIVVIDATLWMAEADIVTEVPYCRFAEFGISEEDWWVDVVNAKHFEKYIKKITKQYDYTFKMNNIYPL